MHKKTIAAAIAAAALFAAMLLPVHADNSKSGSMENYSGKSMGQTVPDTGMRATGEDRATTEAARGADRARNVLDPAYNLNADRDGDTTRTDAGRFRAAANRDGADWSWLGLLGLLGLIGLRNRNNGRA